ncbi:MAG: hypothetical protein WCJ99_01085 [Betaproteobacteria bacterium]|jgi:hypothetical protein
MKKILVTFNVKNIDTWFEGNTLEKEWGQLGVEIEFFRKRDAKLIGFIADISDEDLFDSALKNTTFLSTSFKSNGVLMETLEILELVK